MIDLRLIVKDRPDAGMPELDEAVALAGHAGDHAMGLEHALIDAVGILPLLIGEGA